MQTVREFAEEWKVSVRTVRRWIADGTITAKLIEIITAIQHELEQRETDAYEDRC